MEVKTSQNHLSCWEMNIESFIELKYLFRCLFYEVGVPWSGSVEIKAAAVFGAASCLLPGGRTSPQATPL